MTEVAPKTVVVIPTYNELQSLPILLTQLAALQQPNLHVLVVDDNSPDGTGELADRLAADSGGTVGVLHRTAKDGLGRAYIAGMTRALAEQAEIVIQIDADLSHPVDVIPTMVKVLNTTDAAVVIGSRYVPGGSTAAEWPWHRKALSRRHRGVQGLAVVRAGVDRCRVDPEQRVLLPGRDELPGGQARAADRRGADPLRGAGGGRLQDDTQGAARIGTDALEAAAR